MSEIIDIVPTGEVARFAGYGLTCIARTVVPADSQPGFAHGCICHKLSGTDGTDAVYINIGTNLLCNFDSLTAIAAVISGISTDAISPLTGNSITINGGLQVAEDGITEAGSILSTGAEGGIGYATGSGAAATQSASKSTTVTNTNTDPSTCGTITMNNATLNAGTIVSFAFTNSAIAASDVLVLNHISGGTVGSYTLNAQCGSGSATINVRNNTAGGLSEAIVIQYALIKAVAA